MRVTYLPTASPWSVAAALESALPKVLYDVVRTEDTLCVFIYKNNFENIRKALTLKGVGEPTAIEAAEFTVAVGQANTKAAQKLLLQGFQQRAGNHRSNMRIMNTTEIMEMTIATVLEQTKTMSASKY